MNKTSIKIIKREDARAMVNQKLAATAGGEKAERGLHRKMANTVSIWIAASRENNRAEDVAAIRKILGTESLFTRNG